MSRTARLVVLLVGLAGTAVVLLAGAARLPAFGTPEHPYGDRAVAAAVSRTTANAVAAVTFDQRGFDTLGEESLLVAAVVAVTVLLRPRDDEVVREVTDRDDEAGPRPSRTPDAVRLVGQLLLPMTLLVGGYVVVHGHVSPGGGFQGGVVVATGVHLLYLSRGFSELERLRPVPLVELVEACGLTAYVVVGLVGLAAGSAFLQDVLPGGSFGSLASAGTVPLLNVATGIAVGAGVVLLLAGFLEQVVAVRPREEA